MKSRTRLFLLPLLACATTLNAAQFSVSASSAAPGATVNVSIQVGGDGATQHVATTLLFDQSRLTLGLTPGQIAGAGQNGASCTLRGTNRVEVNRIGTVLPNGQTTLCSLSFQVWPQAVPGSASLTLDQPECSTDAAPVTPCTAVSSSLLVTGSAGGGTVPLAPDERFLFVLLDTGPGAPTVAQVTGFDFSSGQPPPLASLTVGAPIAAFPYLLFRAQGDFAQYLNDYPDTARARLERYLLVEYPPGASLEAPLAALQNDQHIAYAHRPLPMQFSVSSPGEDLPAAGKQPKSAFQQYHLAAIRAPQAWARAGGWGLVGVADSGIATEHPDLRSRTGTGSESGNLVAGGNYLPYYSYNLSDLPSIAQFNPDERIPVPTSSQICDLLDGVDDDLMIVTSAGHGTHVSGLIGASHSSAQQNDIEGICRNCGLGVWKIARAVCIESNTNPTVTPFINATQTSQALTFMSQIGVQVVNQSFGISQLQPFNGFCAANPLDAYCLALQFARETDVLVSAAAGNARTRHQFPARDYSAVAVGGSNESGGLWDESPGSTANCPTSNNGGSPIVLAGECGSNYSAFAGERRSEIVTPARRIRSTIYPGFNWNADISCGDSFGDAQPADGIGLCTGTSMSTPIASGLYGLLRSINPLLQVGSPELPIVPGLRSVVAASTRQAQLGQGWSSTLGYGEPDAEAAVRRLLGQVGGSTALNRASPLFALYSVGAQDYAAVATPQAAMALARYQAASYATTASGGSFTKEQSSPAMRLFQPNLAPPLRYLAPSPMY